MRQEVFEIVQKMDKDNIRTQMALQCAPLITGLKVANLLIIPSKNEEFVGAILDGTDISYMRLAKSECKTTFFLYREASLTVWLTKAENRVLLRETGYNGKVLSDILRAVQIRYEAYVQKGKDFPHEIGVLLGYPAEDVKGFVVNEGKNYLYSGYWKVYGDLSEAKQLFYKFDRAKEALIELVSQGLAGVILAIGRVIGETAALIYTAGTVAEVPKNLMGSGRTLALHMYVLSGEGLHMNQASATAVVILAFVLVINFLSGAVAKRIAKG